MNLYDEILEKLKKLETELLTEIEKRNKQFFYEIRKRKVIFQKEILKRHKERALSTWKYLREIRLRHIIGIPVIYSMIFPAIMLDLMTTLYQWIFFPLFKIKTVRRRDYIVIDRHFLAYLNPLEKFHCVYCGYFNGMISYVREIAALTEYRFCPVKHATTAISFHKHYTGFADFGDVEEYKRKIEELRKMFHEKKWINFSDEVETRKTVSPGKNLSQK